MEAIKGLNGASLSANKLEVKFADMDAGLSPAGDALPICSFFMSHHNVCVSDLASNTCWVCRALSETFRQPLLQKYSPALG